MRTSYGRRVILTEQEANWLWELLKGCDAETPHGRFFHDLADQIIPERGYSLPILETPEIGKEYTPGPWTVDRESGEIAAGDGTLIGAIHLYREGADLPTGEGNALLVESAPDLVAIVPPLARYANRVGGLNMPNIVRDCLTIYELIAQHLGLKGGNQSD